MRNLAAEGQELMFKRWTELSSFQHECSGLDVLCIPLCSIRIPVFLNRVPNVMFQNPMLVH